METDQQVFLHTASHYKSRAVCLQSNGRWDSDDHLNGDALQILILIPTGGRVADEDRDLGDWEFAFPGAARAAGGDGNAETKQGRVIGVHGTRSRLPTSVLVLTTSNLTSSSCMHIIFLLHPHIMSVLCVVVRRLSCGIVQGRRGQQTSRSSRQGPLLTGILEKTAVSGGRRRTTITSGRRVRVGVQRGDNNYINYIGKPDPASADEAETGARTRADVGLGRARGQDRGWW